MPGTFQRFCGLKWPAVRCGNQAQCILARCGLPEISSPAFFSGFCCDVRAFAHTKLECGTRASGGGVTLAALNLPLVPRLAVVNAVCSDSFQGAVFACGQGHAKTVGVKGTGFVKTFCYVCWRVAFALDTKAPYGLKCRNFSHVYPFACTVQESR